MSASRILPPPFNFMQRGYVWDGTTFPVPENVIGAGSHPVGLNFEQIQRWQCRLDLWDTEGQWSDAVGGGATFTQNYGDVPPFDTGQHDFLSREKDALNFLVGYGPTADIILQLSVGLGCLSNADQSLFYPSFTVALGKTFLSTTVGTFAPKVGPVQGLGWVPFCTATIHDGKDTFNIPLFVETGFPGTITSFYQLDYLNFKATDYLLA